MRPGDEALILVLFFMSIYAHTFFCCCPLPVRWTCRNVQNRAMPCRPSGGRRVNTKRRIVSSPDSEDFFCFLLRFRVLFSLLYGAPLRPLSLVCCLSCLLLSLIESTVKLCSILLGGSGGWGEKTVMMFLA